MKAATTASGCRSCHAEWPDTQLIHRHDDATWWTTCPRCGTNQQWAWLETTHTGEGEQ